MNYSKQYGIIPVQSDIEDKVYRYYQRAKETL